MYRVVILGVVLICIAAYLLPILVRSGKMTAHEILPDEPGTIPPSPGLSPLHNDTQAQLRTAAETTQEPVQPGEDK